MRKVIDGATGKEIPPTDLENAFFALSANDFKFSRAEKKHIRRILKAESRFKKQSHKGEGPISRFLRTNK